VTHRCNREVHYQPLSDPLERLHLRSPMRDCLAVHEIKSAQIYPPPRVSIQADELRFE
jgi:hypothetical protein